MHIVGERIVMAGSRHYVRPCPAGTLALQLPWHELTLRLNQLHITGKTTIHAEADIVVQTQPTFVAHNRRALHAHTQAQLAYVKLDEA